MTNIRRGFLIYSGILQFLAGVWLVIALPQLLDRLMTHYEAEKIQKMRGRDSRRYAKVQGIRPAGDDA